MLEVANQGVRLWPSGDSFCEMGVANGCSQMCQGDLVQLDNCHSTSCIHICKNWR